MNIFKSTMLKYFFTFLLSIFVFFTNAQIIPTSKKCGWFCKDTAAITRTYNNQLKYIKLKKGERIASVGAQAGNLEILMSLYIDSIFWTLQDIDTNCLNESNFNINLKYYEQLSKKNITSSFKILIGNESQTLLQENYFDRVLLINTYHEISDKEAIIIDIHKALKKGGKLIINEKIASKKGKKRRDCNHIMTFEPELLETLSKLNFKLINKIKSEKSKNLLFFEFESL